MKKMQLVLGAMVLSAFLGYLGCDDDKSGGCDGCVDDYCDCIEGADEDDLDALGKCIEEVTDCLEKNKCDEDDFDEDETC